jgi:methylmalonyl-CoA/ethylmalonyl-CoA epimerase
LLTRIDHVGIAVKNLNEILDTFRQGFGLEASFIEELEDQKVKIAGFKLADSTVEYFEPTSDDSPISRFLKKRNNALHHIAFKVEDLEQALISLKEKNFELIDESPRKGANNTRIAFLHPAGFNGILIELCES